VGLKLILQSKIFIKMKTSHEGWECVPEFEEAVECIDSISNEIYEIKHCCRNSSTASLKRKMITALKEAIQCLEYIDEDIEYETRYEE
tara:strand:- start:265 stop:528 length:264 start_codon:yes stop_codon:yes gene_type:complete